jgi:BON domain
VRFPPDPRLVSGSGKSNYPGRGGLDARPAPQAVGGGEARPAERYFAPLVDYMLLQAGYADVPVTRPRAAAPLATAAPAPENRTRPADDAAITAGVADALRKSRDIAPPNAQVETYDGVTTVRGTGIRVETREGVVTLRCVVEHAPVVARAEAIARSVGGVKAVDNKLIASSIFEHD